MSTRRPERKLTNRELSKAGRYSRNIGRLRIRQVIALGDLDYAHGELLSNEQRGQLIKHIDRLLEKRRLLPLSTETGNRLRATKWALVREIEDSQR